jgi:hypothetical protein
MGTTLLILLVVLNLLLAVLAARCCAGIRGLATAGLAELTRESASLRESLTKLPRLLLTWPAGWKYEGDLRQEVTDRLSQGFSEIRTTVEGQLTGGRQEQTQDMRQARTELTTALALTTSQLKAEFDSLNQNTAQSLTRFATASTSGFSPSPMAETDQNIKEGLLSSKR